MSRGNHRAYTVIPDAGNDGIERVVSTIDGESAADVCVWVVTLQQDFENAQNAQHYGKRVKPFKYGCKARTPCRDKSRKEITVQFDEFTGTGVELFNLKTFVELDGQNVAQENQEQGYLERERLEVVPNVLALF